MECENGCKYSDDDILCERCRDKVNYEEMLLYWVDENTHYAICKNCSYGVKWKNISLAYVMTNANVKLKWKHVTENK